MVAVAVMIIVKMMIIMKLGSHVAVPPLCFSMIKLSAAVVIIIMFKMLVNLTWQCVSYYFPQQVTFVKLSNWRQLG